MVPVLLFSVAFNLPKFFEFFIQWKPYSHVVVDGDTNATRVENGTDMAFQGRTKGPEFRITMYREWIGT